MVVLAKALRVKMPAGLRRLLIGAAAFAAIGWRSVQAHALLDPEIMQNLLVELHAQQARVAEQAEPGAKAEALFALGARVRSLVDLLNLDLSAHGQSDPLTALFVKRLASMGIAVAAAEKDGRFRYDLDAFRQYLKLSPRGPHAAGARFSLLEQAFRMRTGDVAVPLDAMDAAAARRALPEYERFLADFPLDPHAREARFFLGVECYRLGPRAQDERERERLRDCAQQSLSAVETNYPESVEARAAATLLEQMPSTVR